MIMDIVSYFNLYLRRIACTFYEVIIAVQVHDRIKNQLNTITIKRHSKRTNTFLFINYNGKNRITIIFSYITRLKFL
jgi:hypothetical protein